MLAWESLEGDSIASQVLISYNINYFDLVEASKSNNSNKSLNIININDYHAFLDNLKSNINETDNISLDHPSNILDALEEVLDHDISEGHTSFLAASVLAYRVFLKNEQSLSELSFTEKQERMIALTQRWMGVVALLMKVIYANIFSVNTTLKRDDISIDISNENLYIISNVIVAKLAIQQVLLLGERLLSNISISKFPNNFTSDISASIWLLWAIANCLPDFTPPSLSSAEQLWLLKENIKLSNEAKESLTNISDLLLDFFYPDLVKLPRNKNPSKILSNCPTFKHPTFSHVVWLLPESSAIICRRCLEASNNLQNHQFNSGISSKTSRGYAKESNSINSGSLVYPKVVDLEESIAGIAIGLGRLYQRICKDFEENKRFCADMSYLVATSYLHVLYSCSADNISLSSSALAAMVPFAIAVVDSSEQASQQRGAELIYTLIRHTSAPTLQSMLHWLLPKLLHLVESSEGKGEGYLLLCRSAMLVLISAPVDTYGTIYTHWFLFLEVVSKHILSRVTPSQRTATLRGLLILLSVCPTEVLECILDEYLLSCLSVCMIECWSNSVQISALKLVLVIIKKCSSDIMRECSLRIAIDIRKIKVFYNHFPGDEGSQQIDLQIWCDYVLAKLQDLNHEVLVNLKS